eukprot:12413443-Karenia_brevis.AAC.1
MRGDKTHDHLIKAHFGQVQLKYTLSSSSSNSASGSSDYTDDASAFLSSLPPSPVESISVALPSSPLPSGSDNNSINLTVDADSSFDDSSLETYRARMPKSRQAKLRIMHSLRRRPDILKPVRR